MKTIVIVFCVLFCIQESAGQVNTNSWSVGIGGGHFDADAGLMFSVGTPYFLHNRIATRITGAWRWSENYHATTNGSAPYTGIQAGLVYLITQKDNVGVYIESGANFTFPNKKVTEEHVIIGYYGVLGLDFSLYSNPKIGISYFFEMGLTSNPSYSDTIESEPEYRYGPITNTGFRFSFAKKGG